MPSISALTATEEYVLNPSLNVDGHIFNVFIVATGSGGSRLQAFKPSSLQASEAFSCKPGKPCNCNCLIIITIEK